MSEVRKEDVLEALPPVFLGGQRTIEKLCFRVRDVSLGQIMQIMGEEDKEGRRLMANYLIESLKEYIDRDCIAPPIGEEYLSLEGELNNDADSKKKITNHSEEKVTESKNGLNGSKQQIEL